MKTSIDLIPKSFVLELLEERLYKLDPSGLELESMAKQFGVPISIMAIRFMDIELEDMKKAVETYTPPSPPDDRG